MEALIAHKLRLFESSANVVASEFDEFTLYQNAVKHVALNRRSEIKLNSNFKLSQIAVSNNYFLGLTLNGEIVYWGREAYAHPQGEENLIKVKPFGDDCRFSYVACSSHTCAAINEHGSLYLFGHNRRNRLGLQSPFQRSHNVPIPVPFDEKLTYTQVAVGGDHRVAISNDKNVYIWGKNSRYQLGIDDACLEYMTPTLLQLPGKARKIACGENHTTILMENNDLYLIGNTSKIIGDVDDEPFDAPRHSLRLVASNVTDVACWRYKTAYVTSSRGALGIALDNVFPYELERPRWITMCDASVFVGIDDYSEQRHGEKKVPSSHEANLDGATNALSFFGGNLGNRLLNN